MTREDIIQALRDEAKSNKVSASIFLVCAMRERSRSSLTIAGLVQCMKRKGFTYERYQYEEFLAFLGKLGLGEVVRSRTGKVRALKNIHIQLKSIGNTAMNNSERLVDFRLKNKFVPLMTDRKPEQKSTLTLKTTPVQIKNKRFIKLTVDVDSKPWEFWIPETATTDEITKVLDAVRRKS